MLKPPRHCDSWFHFSRHRSRLWLRQQGRSLDELSVTRTVTNGPVTIRDGHNTPGPQGQTGPPAAARAASLATNSLSESEYCLVFGYLLRWPKAILFPPIAPVSITPTTTTTPTPPSVSPPPHPPTSQTKCLCDNAT